MLGNLKSKTPVWRRNPNTGRLTLSRLYLVTFDGLSRPLLTDKTLKMGTASKYAADFNNFLIGGSTKLRPLPKGILT